VGVVQEYSIHSIPQNKNSMLFMTTLSKKKDMGYAKINKRHAQESMMKKKRSWTHEGPSI